MRLALFAVSLLFVSTVAARADTLQTYDLNAAFSNGTASGTVTFDETNGFFTGGNVTAILNNASLMFNVFELSGTTGTATLEEILSSTQNYTFQISIPGTNNINYSGGLICSGSNYGSCGAPGGGYYYSGVNFGSGSFDAALSGSLTPASAATLTPEPSSFVLLGTALLGMALVFRKRLV
jgi:hypothetical protein